MQCAHEIHGTPTMLHPQSQAGKIRDRQKRNQGSLRGIPDDDDASEEAFRSVLSRFLLLEQEQSRLEDAHGGGAVLDLGLLILHGDHQSRGQVGDTHGGVRGVDALTAGS